MKARRAVAIVLGSGILMAAVLALEQVGVLLSASTANAQPRFNSINICNEGNTAAWVGMVKNEAGFVATSDDNVHSGSGWWRLAPGGCKRLHYHTSWDTRLIYFTFLYQDASGTIGVLGGEPGRGRHFSASEAVFCITIQGPKGDTLPTEFSFRWPNRNEARSWCGQGIEARERWWQPLPFPVQWSVPYRYEAPDRVSTFIIRPDRAVSVWWPVKTPAGDAPPAARSAPPSAVPRSNRGLPTPLKANTVNATILGFPAVRWSDERRWYLYKKGKRITLWGQTRHDLSVPLYNVDRPPQPDVREALAALISRLRLRGTGMSGQAQRAWIDDTGRLYVRQTYTSGDRTDTANLIALDLSSATFSKTYETLAKLAGQKLTSAQIAARRELRVACRADAPACVTRRDNTARSSDVLTIATDEPGLAVLRDTLQQIAGLFRPVTVDISEDASCGCTRIVSKLR